MIPLLDPALQGIIAFVAGLFTLALLVEAARALIWVSMILLVARRLGMFVVLNKTKRKRR